LDFRKGWKADFNQPSQLDRKIPRDTWSFRVLPVLEFDGQPSFRPLTTLAAMPKLVGFPHEKPAWAHEGILSKLAGVVCLMTDAAGLE
jgi:hypothetical protein